MTKTADLAQLAGLQAYTDVIGVGNLYETSLGYAAGALNTGSRNTFVGFYAGTANLSGSDVCAFGSSSLSSNTTGANNTAVGSYSALSNTTGSSNCAFGYYSLAVNSTASSNSAFGHLSLTYCTASNNSAFGNLALVNTSTGSFNTAVGSLAGSSLTTGGNNTCIGANAQPSTATVTSEITLGDGLISALRCATTTITSLSDERDKKNIIDLPAGLAFINAVRPVAFDWNARDESKVDIADTGFLAQNLQQVQAQLGITIPGLVYDTNPEKLEAGYSKLLPVLVKAIQELSARVEALEAAA